MVRIKLEYFRWNIVLEWSDLALFAIFEIGQFAADQEYFYEFNSQKSAKFSFFSITGTLKIHIFLKLQIPFFLL